MINALIQAQLDWWQSFAKPVETPRTPAEIAEDREKYKELISKHIENPEDL